MNQLNKDNAAALMNVDESLMCTFEVLKPAEPKIPLNMRGTNPY